jgi:zinc transport system ATP-binding protein
MSDLILEVKNLSVRFGAETILDNLSFVLKPKDILVIIGPNGAGKSVLLRTLLGGVPHDGQIFWPAGIKIGYVPQKILSPTDVPMTIYDFFSLKKVPEQKVRNLLGLVGINDEVVPRKKMSNISLGQLQRVLIAWALVDDPSVLLFDEPTAGIDIGGEETIYNLLYELWQKKGLAILLVSHDLSVVYKYATATICLNRQRLCYGAPREVLTPETLARIYGSELKFHWHDYE